jgi:hypothetical protein
MHCGLPNPCLGAKLLDRQESLVFVCHCCITLGMLLVSVGLMDMVFHPVHQVLQVEDKASLHLQVGNLFP